jgi:hypothetical protein
LCTRPISRPIVYPDTSRPETTDSEPPRKKDFIIRYWITKDSTEEEGNELTSYVNDKPKKLKETDTTFNLIDW